MKKTLDEYREELLSQLEGTSPDQEAPSPEETYQLLKEAEDVLAADGIKLGDLSDEEFEKLLDAIGLPKEAVENFVEYVESQDAEAEEEGVDDLLAELGPEKVAALEESRLHGYMTGLGLVQALLEGEALMKEAELYEDSDDLEAQALEGVARFLSRRGLL